jgi:hypothetical protein
MKKIYLVIAAFAIGTAAYSQCVIDSTVFNGPTDYGIVPDTATNLPIATVGTGYTTDLQIHVDNDTVTSLGTFPINYIHIDSVTGMPAGFTWLPNPANGTINTTSNNGTGYGCVGVSGNPVYTQEWGGPNSDGVYPITVYFTAEVEVFSVPTDFPSTYEGYRIRIVNPAGVLSPSMVNFSVAQSSANPANFSTDFRIVSPNGGMMNVTVYNVLGSVTRHESISTSKGSNQYTLNTASWAEGVYMCTFELGTAVITRRITVTH